MGFFVDKEIRHYLPSLWLCAEHEADYFVFAVRESGAWRVIMKTHANLKSRWDDSHLADKENELR